MDERKVLVRYRWRYFCPIRQRMITTRGHLPASLIKNEHPDAEPVPGSEDVIELPSDPEALRFSNILRDAPLPDNLPPPFRMEDYVAKKKPPGTGG